MKIYKIEVAVAVPDDDMDEATIALHVANLLESSTVFDDVMNCAAVEIED